MIHNLQRQAQGGRVPRQRRYSDAGVAARRNSSVGAAEYQQKLGAVLHAFQDAVVTSGVVDESSDDSDIDVEDAFFDDDVEAEAVERETAAKRIKCWIPPAILHPASPFKIVWDLSMLTVILYSLWMIPFRIGFALENTTLLIAMDLAMDGFFFLDIALNFFVGYTDSFGVFVYARTPIAMHYLGSWFVIDLLSSLPIDTVVSLVFSGESTIYRSFRLFKVLKLFRLLKLLRLAKLRKTLAALENSDWFHAGSLRMLRLMAEVTFMAHLCACFWHFIPELEGTAEAGQRSWLDVAGIDHNTDIGTRYAISVYWSTKTMMSVGYGDVRAITTAERAYSVVTQIVGVSVFGFLVANISSFLETMNVRASAYRERMSEVREYLHDRKIPLALQRRILRFFAHLWKHKSLFDEQSILAEIPTRLRNEMVLHGRQRIIRRISLLHDQSPSLIALLVSEMTPLSAESQELLAKQNETADQMFFIMQGVVEAHIGRPRERADEHASAREKRFLDVVGVFTLGEHFGHTDVILGTSRSCGLRALTNCSLQTLAKGPLMRAMYLFPQFRKALEKDAIKVQKALDAAIIAVHERSRHPERWAVRELPVAHQGALTLRSVIPGYHQARQLARAHHEMLVEARQTQHASEGAGAVARGISDSWAGSLRHAFQSVSSGLKRKPTLTSVQEGVPGRGAGGHKGGGVGVEGEVLRVDVESKAAATVPVLRSRGSQRLLNASTRAAVQATAAAQSICRVHEPPPFSFTHKLRASDGGCWWRWCCCRLPWSRQLDPHASARMREERRQRHLDRMRLATKKTSSAQIVAMADTAIRQRRRSGVSAGTAGSGRTLGAPPAAEPPLMFQLASKSRSAGKGQPAGAAASDGEAAGLRVKAGATAGSGVAAAETASPGSTPGAGAGAAAGPAWESATARLSPVRTGATTPTSPAPAAKRPLVGGGAPGAARSEESDAMPELSKLELEQRRRAFEEERAQSARKAALALSNVATSRAIIRDAQDLLVAGEAHDVMLTAWSLFKYYGLILDSCTFKVTWDTLVMLLTLVSVIVTPYRIAFEATGGTGTAFIMETVLDCLFLVDICLNFRATYPSSTHEFHVAVPSLVAKHYLQGWFTLDVLATFPFEIIVRAAVTDDAEGSLGLQLVSIVRMLRMLKLARLARLSAMVDNLESVATLSMAPALFQLVKLLFEITFGAHLLGCLWFFLTTIPDVSDGTPTWWAAVNSEMYGAGATSTDNYDQYVASLYWSFSTITTVGYGDVVPANNLERIIAVAVMMLGATVFGYVIGSVTALVSRLNSHSLRRDIKLTQVKEYLREIKAPRGMRKRVLNHYTFLLSVQSVYDEDLILEHLPSSLRHEVVMYNNRDILKKIPFFRSGDDVFVAHMMQLLHPVQASPGEDVFQRGDVGLEMFFIIRGLADVILVDPATDEEVVAETLREGDFFGELALLMDARRQTTVRARKFLHMYSLSKEAVAHTLAEYPSLQIGIRKAMETASARKNRKRTTEVRQHLLSQRYADKWKQAAAEKRARREAEARAQEAAERRAARDAAMTEAAFGAGLGVPVTAAGRQAYFRRHSRSRSGEEGGGAGGAGGAGAGAGPGVGAPAGAGGDSGNSLGGGGVAVTGHTSFHLGPPKASAASGEGKHEGRLRLPTPIDDGSLSALPFVEEVGDDTKADSPVRRRRGNLRRPGATHGATHGSTGAGEGAGTGPRSDGEPDTSDADEADERVASLRSFRKGGTAVTAARGLGARRGNKGIPPARSGRGYAPQPLGGYMESFRALDAIVRTANNTSARHL